MGFYKYVLLFGLVFGILPFLAEALTNLWDTPFQEVFLTKDFLISLISYSIGSIFGGGIVSWYLSQYFYKRSLYKKRKNKDFVEKDDWEESRKQGIFSYVLKVGLIIGSIAHLTIITSNRYEVPFFEAFLAPDFIPNLFRAILIAFLFPGLFLWYINERNYKIRQASTLMGKGAWEEISKKGMLNYLLKFGLIGGTIMQLGLSLLGMQDEGASFIEAFFNIHNILLSMITVAVGGGLPSWYLNQYTHKQRLVQKNILAANERLKIESVESLASSQKTIEIDINHQSKFD